MAEIRRQVVTVLSTQFGSKLAKKYEKAIYARALNDKTEISKGPENLGDLPLKYREIAFELSGRLVAAAAQNDTSVDAILTESLDSELDSELYGAEKKNLEKLHADSTFKPDVKEGSIQCRRCRAKRTWYYQMQTRSADEGMCTYYVCAACGYRWKG